jgi:trehalose 6-phosphate phosphatase
MSPSRHMSNTALPAAAADWALFLDIDGTLLDLAPTPDAVTVPGELPRVMGEAAGALGGALALVSGRPVSWIDRTFAPLCLAAAGQHGGELRLTPGGPVLESPQAGDLAPISRWLTAAVAAWPGVIVEDKGVSLAVHYRQAPERAADVHRLLDRAAAEAGERFHLMPGKMVIELKPSGSSKGMVVAAMMDVAPFAGRRPVFIGDDRTDEDGFREVLARGGFAVQVGADGSTIASHQISGPAALREWLTALPTMVRRGAA